MTDLAPSPPLAITEFADRGAMVDAAAAALATNLRMGLTERGVASLAASGGSTPGPVYARLSKAELDWSDVTVALVDERWVEPHEEGSNAALVCDTLLHNEAKAARFAPMKTPDVTPLDAVGAIDQTYADIPAPFDAVVLGLGADGHTASWFPHAEGLAAAIDPTNTRRVAAVRAKPSPVAGVYLDRMTLTFAPLAHARAVFLLITGEEKRATLETARGDGPVEDMPVRALLRHAAAKLQVLWAP